MQVENKLLDDLARLASGAAGALSGIRGEVEAQFRQQFERILAQMDVVSREEFEAVKAMAAAARTQQEEIEDVFKLKADLEDRVVQLEALVATLMAHLELSGPEPAPKRPAHAASPAPADPDTQPEA
ncbi:accessory factor UbiK family protein [Oleisolibacter albus]|uniref:accessory factor UbiK family protein n=1 Tax=Oleisolibacter albus TaxID=2171757 RepID=UPI000DF3B706|nr:accessory factor UbiK family protein [Oleisolibacter albus]